MDVARECDQLQFMDRETISKYISPLTKKKTVETKLPPPTKDMRTKDPAFPTFVWTLSEDSLARDLESQLKTSPEEELDYMDVEEAPVHSSLNRPSPKVGTACYVGPTESGNGLVSCKLLHKYAERRVLRTFSVGAEEAHPESFNSPGEDYTLN